MTRLDAGPRATHDPSSAPGRRGPALGPWGNAVLVTAATRVAFFALAYAATWFLSGEQGQPNQGFFDTWTHWDARLLQLVAEHGYTDPATDPHATAFFPLFPLLVAGLTAIGIAPPAAGIAISTLATVIALAYLYRLAEEEMGPGAGRRAALYLALFPTAVFLVAPYTEALFLAGAIPAFYYARRKRWRLVGLPAAVAMGARFAGVFLIVGLAFEFLRQRDFRHAAIRDAGAALVAGLVPLIAYAAYLAQVKGDAFYFVTDQREGWGREWTNPATAFTTTWDTWEGAGYPSDWILAWRFEIAAAVIGVALVIVALGLREWGYAAFMAPMMVVLLGSSHYLSIPRMLLTFFPATLFLARVTTRPEMHEIALVLLASGAALGVVVYTSGAWFF